MLVNFFGYIEGLYYEVFVLGLCDQCGFKDVGRNDMCYFRFDFINFLGDLQVICFYFLIIYGMQLFYVNIE